MTTNCSFDMRCPDRRVVTPGATFLSIGALVAFTALVAASIYDLDLDLANSCWLITTGSLVVVLPWISYLLTLL